MNKTGEIFRKTIIIFQNKQRMNIDIKTDRSERVKYNTAGLPVYFQKGTLSSYPNYAAESHWHDDLEFTVVLSGKMQYNVNGETVTLETGNGIFVNSRQFHYGFSADFTECEFLCVLMHPVLLAASQYIDKKFVTPILNNSKLPYHLLHSTVRWEQKILSAVSKVFSADELETIILFYTVWNELCKNKHYIVHQPVCKNSKLNALKNMVSFIQNNYKEKICLADIAKQGAVGKTECCTIFHTYTNTTPIVYLNDFRLRKSAELLTRTDMTISEICYEAGFSDASYFTKTFRNTFHCTPKAYRNINKK